MVVLRTDLTAFDLEVYQYARRIIGSTSEVVLVRHVILHLLLLGDQHLLFLFVLQFNLVRQTDQWLVEHIDRIKLSQVFLPEEEVETKSQSEVDTRADTCVPGHHAVIYQSAIGFCLQVWLRTDRRTKHLVDANLDLRISRCTCLCMGIDI